MTPWPAPHATRPVNAEVALPGSKSLTNRALVLAAIAEADSVIYGALRSRDTELMAAALTSLGATVDTTGEDWKVSPLAPERSHGEETAIDVGLAGTVMRFVPPLAALSTGSVRFDGDEHMRQRPVGAILQGLRDLGVRVDGDALPFAVQGGGSVRGGVATIDASTSSQFVSALLLAGARYDLGVDLRHVGPPIPSQPHIDMTIEMLRENGVTVTAEAERWVVAPGPVQALDRRIEPDLSNAAPFLGLAALTGGTVTVKHWPSATTQPGDHLRDLLTQMGCSVTLTDADLTLTGPKRGTLTGLHADLHDVGELTPAIAALCALASSPSRLTGIAHIRGHETDRLAALATELTALGADVVEHPDGLSINPAPLHGGVFHTYADHRMAHAGVLIGAVVPGVEVENVETTSKTFLDFAPFWASLFED